MKLLVEYFRKLWKVIKFLIKKLFRRKTNEIKFNNESYFKDSSESIDTNKNQVDITKWPKTSKESSIGRTVEKRTSSNNTVIIENFYSIESLIQTLRHRDNNPVMYCRHASADERYEFTRTYSYGEAESLLQNGYTKILSKIKSKYKKNVRALSQNYVIKSRTQNTIAGGCPNIPRTLMCLPKDLMNREPVIRKSKTIDIIYSSSANCYVDPQVFIESGIALLSAIEILEMRGTQIRLSCCFFGAKETSYRYCESVLGSLILKNYSDRLNIKKLCFPLAHPSMLRRIGFKFLETIPNITCEDFSFGYGRALTMEELNEIYKDARNTVVMNVTFIESLEFDVTKIIQYIEDYVTNKNQIYQIFK